MVFNRPCVTGAVLQTPFFNWRPPLIFKVEIHLQSLAFTEILRPFTWDLALRKFRGAPVNTVVFRR